jgi:hypothetical protein
MLRMLMQSQMLGLFDHEKKAGDAEASADAVAAPVAAGEVDVSAPPDQTDLPAPAGDVHPPALAADSTPPAPAGTLATEAGDETATAAWPSTTLNPAPP